MEKINDLRFGHVAFIYYEACSQKMPKQLDLLDEWFPGLMVQAFEKNDAEFIDTEFMIYAKKEKDTYTIGFSNRVTQLCGRLVGTAKGNAEKERKSCELIQKHLSKRIVEDMELMPALQQNVYEHLSSLKEEHMEVFIERIFEYLDNLVSDREVMNEYERNQEPFPMHDETYDGTVYNFAYQLHMDTDYALTNAYLWLLTASLLRDEIGRVLRVYDSSFIAVNRQLSEDGTLRDKLNYLFSPEEYGSTYSGDDLDNRFPGIEWYCDECNAHLNEQKDFNDHKDIWKCTACGYENKLAITEIYDNDEDRHNRISPINEEKFYEALSNRRNEKKK